MFTNGVQMVVLTARVFANNTVKTERTPKLGNAAIRAGELEGICAKKAHRYALIIDRPETKWILALN
jgi:hypothetical protein